MDKKTLEKFKILLEKEKRKLEKQLNTFTKKSHEIKGDYKTQRPNIGTDDDENAIEIAMYDNALPLEHNFELRLLKINKALAKISAKDGKGKYGICKKCKKGIDVKRLEIYPEARCCMKCHKA